MADSLLKWANRNTRGHDHITPVNDYEEGWADGLAFCALFYAYFPEKIPIKTLKADTEADKLKNLELAFKVGADAGIERLLDPDDTMIHHEKKSIMLYLSEIYGVLKDLPVKFSASSEWNKKFDAEEKARKFAEWKAKKEAEARGEVYTPQKAGRSGSVAAKWNPDGNKDEEESTPAKATPTASVQGRWNPKASTEEKEEKPTVTKTVTPVPEQPKSSGSEEGLTFEISGRGKDGGEEGKMLIFTATFKMDGKLLANAKKEDLLVHLECPGTPPRFNVMGGPGGAYHIGFTPATAGQYWFDFVWKGTWCSEPFMLPIKNKLKKLPDFPYTGAERKAAGKSGNTSSTPATSTPSRTVQKIVEKPKQPSAEHSICSDRTAEMNDEDLGEFTITAKDDSDQILKGDFHFDVKITGPSAVESRLKNNGDGTYACSFGPVPSHGSYVILVTINGKEIKKGKWDLKVTDALADVEFEDVTVLFHATDKLGNPKSTGGDTFEVIATGDELPEIDDLGDGGYTLDYHVIPGQNLINVLYNGESLSGFPIVFEV